MGITPIVNLTELPVVRSAQSDLEPQPMQRVENSARTGDETYSPSNGQSASGSEDDGPQDEFESVAGEDEEEPTTIQPDGDDPGLQISFFA